MSTIAEIEMKLGQKIIPLKYFLTFFLKYDSQTNNCVLIYKSMKECKIKTPKVK